MIRKPEAGEFRESGTVLALRDAGTVAAEGARGIHQGTAQFLGRGLAMLLGLGFLLSIGRHLGPFAILFTSAGALALFLRTRRKDMAATAFALGAGSFAFGISSAAQAVRTETYELSVGAVARKAAKASVLAILCFPTRAYFYMAPFAVFSIIALATAMLTLARLAGDRTVLRFDAGSVTVHGLVGTAAILWDDVSDVFIHKASFFNIKARLTSGSRHNLIVRGVRNRLGGPEALYVPIDLLGLKGDALATLVSQLLAIQASAARPVGNASSPRPTPRQVTVASDQPGFDPDAIIARYMAERQGAEPAVDQRSALRARPAFGRKIG